MLMDFQVGCLGLPLLAELAAAAVWIKLLLCAGASSCLLKLAGSVAASSTEIFTHVWASKLLVLLGSQAACQTPWSALLLCPRTHANPSADLATIWWGCIISAHDPFERHDKLLPRCIPCSKC